MLHFTLIDILNIYIYRTEDRYLLHLCFMWILTWLVLWSLGHWLPWCLVLSSYFAVSVTFTEELCHKLLRKREKHFIL